MSYLKIAPEHFRNSTSLPTISLSKGTAYNFKTLRHGKAAWLSTATPGFWNELLICKVHRQPLVLDEWELCWWSLGTTNTRNTFNCCIYVSYPIDSRNLSHYEGPFSSLLVECFHVSLSLSFMQQYLVLLASISS